MKKDTVLLPYQIRWNREPAKLAVAEKGRRIGLSWSEAAEDALLASKPAKSGGMNVWYVSYNKEMTEQFVRDTAFFARMYSLAASDVFEDEEVFMEGDEKTAVTVYRIRFESGHMVTGLPSHPRVLRSKQGKVVIDEAAFVDNLDELLKAALALLIWGAIVRVISTHNGEDNPFNQLIQDIRGGKRPGAVVHRYPFLDAVDEGLYRRICRKQGVPWTPEAEAKFVAETYDLYGDDAEEELDCIPSKGGGAYLLRTTIEACWDEIPIMRWSPPAKDFVDWRDDQRYREMRDWCASELDRVLPLLPHKPLYFGEDFGRTCDLTVVWPLVEAPLGTFRTPFLLEIRDCPFAQQEQVLFYFLDRVPMLAGGALDKSGNGAFLAERARQHVGESRIDEVSFHDSWNLENWPRAKAMLEDKTVTTPKDDDVLDDLRAVQKVKGVPKIPDVRTRAGDGGKRHGDAAVAFVLAVYASKKFEYAGPAEYQTVTKRRIPRRGAW